MRTRHMLAAIALITIAAESRAGPINPPAGPVTPTPGPEPRTPISSATTPGDSDGTPSVYKITQPGSYYLTGNITGVVGKHGIEIAASGVTLDLNGFDLVGVPGMGAFDGLSTTVFGLTDICVLNGSVRNWGGNGVNLGSQVLELGAPGTANSRVADVRASGNAGAGIRTEFSSTITGCAASGNGGVGISASDGSTITGCSASGNSSDGILAGFGATIAGCSVARNAGNGISTGGGGTITGCSAYANTITGFFPGNGSTVAQCTARQNVGDGIRVASQCVVLANTCSGNGTGAGDGAGVHATGADNRIEGNTCTGADRGVDVDAAGNMVIRNTCSGNTANWTIVANNVVGPILDRTAPASAAIIGNSAASSLGSTDANANFTY
jgi:parallel beta-helix repeat protein